MSDNIEIDEAGTAYYADSRSDAWHQLGQQVNHLMTSREVMTEAHLGDWAVRKSPIQTITEDGIFEVPNHYAMVRTNPSTGLAEPFAGVTGAKYEPIQNETNCDVLDYITDEYGAHFETAGSLNNGRNVFVTMKLPKTMSVGGVDPMDLYLAALNSHDGQTSFTLLVTIIRIVCANTQAAALNNFKSKFTISHTKNAAGRIAAARQAMGLTFEYADAFDREATAMLNKAMQVDAFVELTRKVWKSTDAADAKSKRGATLQLAREGELVRLFREADTNELIRGTAWAGYQAITEYLDHTQPVRVGNHGDAETARALRTAMGRNDDTKAFAFAQTRAFVNA